jgi:hypothetical protein
MNSEYCGWLAAMGFFVFVFSVLEFELGVYTLSHSTSPFL